MLAEHEILHNDYINQKSLLQKRAQKFDFRIFEEISQRNEHPNQSQEDQNLQHQFERFCMLQIIVHGKVKNYLKQADDTTMDNEFLRNLNVLQAIKNIIDIVEEKKYSFEDVKKFFPQPNLQAREQKSNVLDQFTDNAVDFIYAFNRYEEQKLKRESFKSDHVQAVTDEVNVEANILSDSIVDISIQHQKPSHNPYL